MEVRKQETSPSTVEVVRVDWPLSWCCLNIYTYIFTRGQVGCLYVCVVVMMGRKFVEVSWGQTLGDIKGGQP